MSSYVQAFPLAPAVQPCPVMRALVAVALVCVSTAAVADDAEPARPLTLDDALARARAKNRDLRAARARLDQSRTGIEQARAALLPTVAAQGKYTHNNKEVELTLPTGGAPIVITKGEQLDFALTGTVPLVSLPAYSSLSAARSTQRANDARYAATEADILLTVAQAYFAAAGADQLVTARAHAVEIAEKTSADAQARVAADMANQVDVMRAETALVRAKQARVEADNTRASAYRALATLVDADAATLVLAPPAATAATVATAATTDAGADTAAVDSLVILARASRPELAAERATIAAASSSARAAGFRWLPSLSAFGSLRAFNYEGFSGDKYAWSVGLELDWVIFDGGIRDAQRHAATAQRREAEARLDELDDQVADEVADARGSLATKRSAVDAAQQALDLATETLRLVRAQYEAGAVRQLDVLAAQDTLVDAEVGVVQANYELQLADLQLRRVTGAFPGSRP
jgi:outer membrane protein TolC